MRERIGEKERWGEREERREGKVGEKVRWGTERRGKKRDIMRERRGEKDWGREKRGEKERSG